MDDADRAAEVIEAELECCVAAARGVAPPTPRPTCCDCAEPLEAYRKAYGICVPCQSRRERGLARRLRWS
jgi:hypothetical protein